MAIDPSARIHPSAVVEEGAEIGPEVEIGPFCHVGAEVRLGPRVRLQSHVVVTGDTEIGEETQVFPFACLGNPPQDLKFGGEKTRLRIGKRNMIREYVTMNPGTAHGGGETRIGDDCLFMASSHVAHDCKVGNHVVMVNSSALAGHCQIGDHAIIGGLSGVHQWVRVGRGAITGALSRVAHDVLPNAMVHNDNARMQGLNLIGLKRRGASRQDIAALQEAIEFLRTGEGTFQERAARLLETSDNPHVREIAEFILAESDRGFHTPR